jgi:hypothetical protein
MLKSTDEAREYFKPLTYDDLTNQSFNMLCAILEEYLGKWNRKVLEDRNKYGHDNRYYMSIHPHRPFSKYPGTRFKDKEAFIIIECDHYSYREGISFNKDGWIGFAGWSDSDNKKPFLDAFEEWVNLLKQEKGLQKLSTNKNDINICTSDILTGYIVDEFPNNPVMGRLVNKAGIDYVFNGINWLAITNC